MDFIWDPAKERINRREHGIDFDTAMRVFSDPHATSRLDRIEGGEERWQIVGSVGGTMPILVAYTTWDENDGAEIVRIISARHATKHERRKHENGKAYH
jgi:uncharacterized DUF497 family protein